MIKPNGSAPWRRLYLSERHDIWCLVDAIDLPWIVEHKWNYGWHVKTRWKYYAKRNVGAARSTVYLHREILKRADPRDDLYYASHHAHHKNGNSLDNRRSNLAWLKPGDNSGLTRSRDKVPSLEAIMARLIRQQVREAAHIAATLECD